MIKNIKIIYIVGPPKSGTTLLQRIISSSIKGNKFIQYAGHKVEHRVNDDMFRETDKTDFTKEEVLELFLLFLKDPGKISEKYEWSDATM